MSREGEFGLGFAPVRDLGAGDALKDWRWLTGPKAQVRMLTALGDPIVLKPAGLLRRRAVFWLDTCTGKLRRLASGWEEFRVKARDGDWSEEWLMTGFVAELRRRGIVLAEGECYSPVVAPVLGGAFEPENFKPVSWRVHVSLMGQLHEQIKDVPDGTPVSFDVGDS